MRPISSPPDMWSLAPCLPTACPTKILHHLTLVFWDTIYKLEITCSIIADCCITSMPRIMYIEAMQVTFTHQGYTEAGVVTKSN